MKRESSRISIVAPKIRPVLKLSISDEIVDQIMALISRGDLKPGQRLPSERELCVRFGAGRSSLREALRCLSIVGVLDARVGEGTSVAADGGKFLGRILEWRLITERHEIEDLMEVRIALEGMSAASAARSRNKDDLKAVDALLERMKRFQDDRKRFAALDVDFHLAVAKASGNPLLSDMISMIRGQLVRALSRVLLTTNAVPLSLKEHVRIIEAIRRGDSETACEAMSDHLKSSLSRYRSFIATETQSVERGLPPVRKFALPKPKKASSLPKVFLTQR
jgi:GntR family transcriptional regulator, transcriptional repressor for pyruvate dehydrogenase complex